MGEVKKTWKKYADIKWLKNNEPWDPKADGKEKFNGFTIRYKSFVLKATRIMNIILATTSVENLLPLSNWQRSKHMA